ncbi:MAG: PepSY-associated TM helix domain-containing protein [bacterium]
MRNALIVFHRWLALVTSIVIILAGLTGGALVFEGAIDRGLNPQLWRVTPAGPVLPLDTIVAHARAAVPKATVTGLSLARTPDRAYVASAGPTQIFVDQYNGRVLGTRDRKDFDQTLPRILHRLHTDLMVGAVGSELIGIATIAALLLVITGMYLWWAEKLWRIRWSASWKRIAYDLHHSLGIIASLVLLAITASGAAIHYESLRGVIACLDGARTRAVKPPVVVVGDAAGASPVSLDSAVRTATGALPEATVTMMSLPKKADQPLLITMRFAEDRTPGGRTKVYVNGNSGAVLRVESTRVAGMGTKANNQMRSIHTGDVFGQPTEVIWLVAALVLAGQGMTGVMMWWNGRPARAALARKAQQQRGGPLVSS